MKRKPKVKRLLNQLTNSELGEVKETLLRDKKIRGLILIDALSTSEEAWTDEEKSKIFLKLFEQKYQTKKDYLLRNEFRLLQVKVEDYLVDKQVKEELENNKNTYNFYLLKA